MQPKTLETPRTGTRLSDLIRELEDARTIVGDAEVRPAEYFAPGSVTVEIDTENQCVRLR